MKSATAVRAAAALDSSSAATTSSPIAPTAALCQALPFPILAFTARCGARAKLVAAGEMTLLDAVDGLQAAAVQAGLVDVFGQDSVQQIMADAFECPPPELPRVVEPPMSMTKKGAAYRLVSRDGVASAAELQRDYDAACRRAREHHGPAKSTIDAFQSVVNAGDPSALETWLRRRPTREVAKLLDLAGAT